MMSSLWKKNTAPGPDHMPIEFFQSCRDFLQSDFWLLFQDFHEHRLDIGRLNYGTIILLPKTKEANVIQQYRPMKRPLIREDLNVIQTSVPGG